MQYIHTDIFHKQSPKYKGNACGDVFNSFRDEHATTIVLSDGLGSGIQANIAANLCVSRLVQLIKSGAGAHQAFSSVAKTMNKAWGKSKVFAVFTVVRILNSGQTTILSYEMPPPVFISDNNAQVLKGRVYTHQKAIINEIHTTIAKNEGILIVSDGITQAGMGQGLQNGWEIENVASFVSSTLFDDKIEADKIVDFVHRQARKFWGRTKGDDCSVVMAKTRRGIILNVLSGPPKEKQSDKQMVEEFMTSEGLKIACGGSSSKMLARETGRRLEVKDSKNPITPPKYSINGINLVTEGIVSLNQVYNILDEDTQNKTEDSPVYELAEFLKSADKIVFFQGQAQPAGAEHLIFKQQGILKREKIIKLLVEKLKASGKLVIVKEF